ncbi:protein PSK SIMULATOR 1-like [Rosa rugosa]|uniref:protein PSK SIMULATOR 1-like n=1 Tax=Rosa rugosa TaxID=74645 RepID=UPI002B405E0D|nr:protein PSK SIMULATOR 1-like [Rosa rugosa]
MPSHGFWHSLVQRLLWRQVVWEQGDNLAILKADVKNQMKLVNSLKKKSLWSKTFEEVMPKLVDIVQLLHFKIHEAFESTDDDEPVKCSLRNCER